MNGGALEFTLDGRTVSVSGVGSLLDALREELGVTSAKDGCSPQGQCGCCTVWVDGAPRVACVTPVTRVRGRSVTTIDGLPSAAGWARSFAAHGASQCGFCTPGIIMRVAALPEEKRRSPDAVKQSLLAHLCRCTGWQTIVEAVLDGPSDASIDAAAAAERATIEGGVPQRVGSEIALGAGGFADDTAPGDAIVALRSGPDEWVTGASLAEARVKVGKVQGRRTTAPVRHPIELPPGDWDRVLRTTWVEPAYLEPDSSWCEPGAQWASSLANGGAFGGKATTEVGTMARHLADVHGRAVRVLATREDVVRNGPKRPPIAAGIRADGTGAIRVVRTPGIVDAIRSVAPELSVEEVDVPGPPTSTGLRAAGWAEAVILLSSLRDHDEVVAPNGAVARARIDDAGDVHVSVRCGRPLDRTALRSYCIGAAHMALGWVRSEGIAVDDNGAPLDLTIRSFGILRAVDMPSVHVEIDDDEGEPINGSDAVFAAVAAAAWRHAGFPPAWPVGR
ncbi:MAG TPA: 2Fe-2S iron-sulfur cluster-binding protein [Ilumatobacteraceae bacterium]